MTRQERLEAATRGVARVLERVYDGNLPAMLLAWIVPQGHEGATEIEMVSNGNEVQQSVLAANMVVKIVERPGGDNQIDLDNERG
jgi:hypothetical protein